MGGWALILVQTGQGFCWNAILWGRFAEFLHQIRVFEHRDVVYRKLLQRERHYGPPDLQGNLFPFNSVRFSQENQRSELRVIIEDGKAPVDVFNKRMESRNGNVVLSQIAVMSSALYQW